MRNAFTIGATLLGLLAAPAALAANFHASARISLENGAAEDNVVDTGTAPAVSNASIVCGGAPYHGGTADTTVENGRAWLVADTQTCRGPLPIAAQVFQVGSWEWDDVLVTGPAGNVSVTLHLNYRVEDDYPSDDIFQVALPGTTSFDLPATGGAWSSYSHSFSLPANTPSTVEIWFQLNAFLGPHLSVGQGDATISLASLAFEVPAGYAIDVPSAGVVGGIYPDAWAERVASLLPTAAARLRRQGQAHDRSAGALDG